LLDRLELVRHDLRSTCRSRHPVRVIGRPERLALLRADLLIRALGEDRGKVHPKRMMLVNPSFARVPLGPGCTQPLDSGAITRAEFEAIKAKALA
jgi:hypothetical protein